MVTSAFIPRTPADAALEHPRIALVLVSQRQPNAQEFLPWR
jgi:hypothetical protein